MEDNSAFLCIPAAIEFMQENNWAEVAKARRFLTQQNAERFCTLLNAEPLSPVTDDFVLQLYSIPIVTNEPAKLQDLLYEKYKIQIPVMVHGDKIYLRYSLQAFNDGEDLDKLYSALGEINILEGTN